MSRFCHTDIFYFLVHSSAPMDFCGGGFALDKGINNYSSNEYTAKEACNCYRHVTCVVHALVLAGTGTLATPWQICRDAIAHFVWLAIEIVVLEQTAGANFGNKPHRFERMWQTTLDFVVFEVEAAVAVAFKGIRK